MPDPAAPAPAPPEGTQPAPRDPMLLPGSVLGVVLCGLWTWWVLEDGAFFESVAYPGAILLMLTMAVLLVAAPPRLRTKGPHAMALAAMVGLFAWTLLSLLWTPSRDVALEDGGRLLIYATSFLAGLMLASFLGRRAILAVLPYCLAGAIVAVTVTIAMLGVDVSTDVLDEAGTLDYPFEYRNANAAFFVGVALATLGVATIRDIPLPAGVGAAALATLCFQLALLSQSRASAPALVIGALVLMVASRDRLRLLALALCVAVPVVLATPTLLEPFSAFEDGAGGEAELVRAARAMLVAVAGAAVATAVSLALLGRFAPRIQLGRRARTSLLAGVAALTLAAGGAFVLAVGDPLSWINEQVASRFAEQRDEADTRFLYSGGRDRTDFWRVSINAVEENPLIGDGSGAFRQRYVLERRSGEIPLDAHSLPLETLAELGAIGLLLLLLAGVAIVVGIRRSARIGPRTAALSAAALGTGAYYLAHASIDWLWSFPGLTAPVITLLGIASAPAADCTKELPRAIAWPLAVALTLFSLAIAPLFLSARYITRAEALATTDPASARDDLRTAARLNPFADQPYLRAADIARREGETELALSLLAKAREREPKEWVNYALVAQALLSEDPEGARAAIRQARRLNPNERDLDELERQIGRSAR